MHEINTPRLSLRLLNEDFLEATLNADAAKTESLIGLKIPPDWFDEVDLSRVRLDDYRADAGYLPYGLRAVGLRESGEMIGFIGFHTSPNPEYLQKYAPHAIEIGYTIFVPHRRCGFAHESVVGMFDWAARQYPVGTFIASVSPTNLPSTAMIKNMKFEKIGEQMDEVDGLEFVYALAVSKLNFLQ